MERSGECALVIVFACDNLETFENIIRYTIYDSMDFIDRDISGHLDRSQLLTWWGAIIEDAAKLSTSPAKVVQSVEKAKSWLVKQVALTIAMALASFNGKTEEWWKFFWKVVLQGEDRMKDMTYTLKHLSEIQSGIMAKIHEKCFISWHLIFFIYLLVDQRSSLMIIDRLAFFF